MVLINLKIEEFTQIALGLCGKVDLGPQQLFRLAGVGLSNFARETEESASQEAGASPSAEHFFEPGAELRRLDALLRPGGWLGIMTELLDEQRVFAQWRYLTSSLSSWHPPLTGRLDSMFETGYIRDASVGLYSTHLPSP